VAHFDVKLLLLHRVVFTSPRGQC